MDLLGAEPETDPELAGENTSNLIQDGLRTPPEEVTRCLRRRSGIPSECPETTTSDREKKDGRVDCRSGMLEQQRCCSSCSSYSCSANRPLL